MKCPQYAQVGEEVYKINTDFRVAIECNRIGEDVNIGDRERALAIIYLLYGDKGLKDGKNHPKLLELGLKYLRCGEEEKKKHEEPDMDYIQDMDYIEASFMTDYNIDLTATDMDWWKFNKLMNGLSNSEMGNCCVLNRVRNLRNMDIKDIKDKKTRDKILEAKKMVALKKQKPKKKPNEDEKQSAMDFLNALKKGKE